MKRSLAALALLFALGLTFGCRPKQTQTPSHMTQTAPPTGATNSFVIHLQDGFDQNRETIITVDGQEVYRGHPHTSPLLGLAGTISACATSAHPVITLKVPTGGVDWSQTIDLKAGVALGISLRTNGQIEFLQGNRFGYD